MILRFWRWLAVPGALTFSSGLAQSTQPKPDTLSITRFETKVQWWDSLCTRQAYSTFDQNTYSALKGVTTFRGGPYRNTASWGFLNKRPDSLVIQWEFSTKADREWGGGAGWTGQPNVVQWPDSVRQVMKIAANLKTDSAFTEVIQPSLDGNIYFLNLATGKPSRPPVNIKNPIKGSPAIDPRGYPLLYCGQGINRSGEFGFRIFSLIDGRKLYTLNGRDPFAHRTWGAFDGAPLLDAVNDRLVVAGENGVLYTADLHTQYEPDSGFIRVQPRVNRYRYQKPGGTRQGVENSVAAFANLLYFADNDGNIQAVDIATLQPVWFHHNHDDTDATAVLDVPDSIPYLYTGSEVDLQGNKGFTFLKKINGVTGTTVWEKKYPCFSIRGAHPVNGGMLSTPVLGKFLAKNLLVASLSRYGSVEKGLLVALDKETGGERWKLELAHYAWSSPLDMYDREGNLYIFLADSRGHVMLIDGATGTVMFQKKIADLFEASPVAFNNRIVIASRPRKIFCLEVR